MISISSVMFLFGLTWFFAILTFSIPGLRETGSILFTIFNSFQGFFIFLFFCVISKEARESWKEFLSCGKYTSQFLHPSHIKFISSGGMTGTLKTNTMKSDTGTMSSPGGGMYSPTNVDPVKFNFETCTLIKNKSFEPKVPLDSEATLFSKVDSKVPDQYLGTPLFSGSATSGKTSETAALTITNDTAVDLNSSHQSGVTNSKKKKEGKRMKDRPLNVRIRCNSTKKLGKHHTEVMEVDFYSNRSSDSEDNITTKL